MITKKIFPFFNYENGKLSTNRDEEYMYITGTRIEYRFLGILFYAKTLYNPHYYSGGTCTQNHMEINF